jgi:hypothetical protein
MLDVAMRRRLPNLLTALSLLLCAAVCVLWVRSRSRYDIVLFGGGGGTLLKFLSDDRGVGVVALRRWPYAEPVRWLRGPVDDRLSGRAYTGGSLREWRFAPLGVSAAGWLTNYDDEAGRPMLANDVQVYSVHLPHVMLALGLAAPSAALGLLRAARRGRRRRRASRSVCPSCGYDLRATPDRCPECGTARSKRT